MASLSFRLGATTIEVQFEEGEDLSAAIPLLKEHCKYKLWYRFELVEPVPARMRDRWYNLRIPHLRTWPPPEPVKTIKLVQPEYVPPPHIETRPAELQPRVFAPREPYTINFGKGFGEEPFIPHNWGNDDGDLFDHLDPQTRDLIRDAIVINDFAIEAHFHGEAA